MWCGCGVRGAVGDTGALGALGGSVVDTLLSPGHGTHHRCGVGTRGTCSTCAVDGGRSLTHRGVRGAFMPFRASVEIGDHSHLLPYETSPYGRKWTRVSASPTPRDTGRRPGTREPHMKRGCWKPFGFRHPCALAGRPYRSSPWTGPTGPEPSVTCDSPVWLSSSHSSQDNCQKPQPLSHSNSRSVPVVSRMSPIMVLVKNHCASSIRRLVQPLEVLPEPIALLLDISWMNSPLLEVRTAYSTSTL